MTIYNAMIDVSGNVSKVMVIKDGASFVLSDPSAQDPEAVLFQAWLVAGNTLGAPVKPPAADPLTSWDAITLQISFNHENRIRALESKVPITIAQFRTAIKALLP